MTHYGNESQKRSVGCFRGPLLGQKVFMVTSVCAIYFAPGIQFCLFRTRMSAASVLTKKTWLHGEFKVDCLFIIAKPQSYSKSQISFCEESPCPPERSCSGLQTPQ